MVRVRRDLELDLGRPSADSECCELLEAQVDRLWRSIGEYD